MPASYWLRKGAPPTRLTDLGAESCLHRVVNRGPGDVRLFGDRRLSAGDSHDVVTAGLTAELAPDSPFDVGLIEWEVEM